MLTPVSRVLHEWVMFSRTPTYALDRQLPIVSAQMVLRHMGADTAVIVTPFNDAAWIALQPACGVVLYRDGVQQFSGLVTELEMDWDKDSGRAVIKAVCASDEIRLADSLVFPDPLRISEDQTVNDYWTYTGVASTAMRQLISDQVGPTARANRRINGIVLGADPVVGVSRKWKGLFVPHVLDQLALMSIASGQNLGLRSSTTPGSVTFTVVATRDLSAGVRFAADFGNLAGFTFRQTAPTVTNAVAAGQGDLHLRLRRAAGTADTLSLAWGRMVWQYVDQRDTADTADLLASAQDAVAEGASTVSLSVTLIDSEAATYGRDWGLGDKVSVYVGLPGQTSVATVSDVVREIFIEVTDTGAETIRPAIGSFDAKAVIPTPTQRQLTRVGMALGGFMARK